MNGREERQENDLFFTCSLIEYIARKTKNKRSTVVNALGKTMIEKIYNLADVYHSDNINAVSEDFIHQANISEGDFDNVSASRFAVPSYWNIGKVYKRLVLGIMKEKKISFPDAVLEAYNSFVSNKIDDYNSSFYYEAPQNILNAYLDGKIE